MQVVKELCCAVVKDPINPSSEYRIYTGEYYISPQVADELLGVNMATAGTVMPFRRKRELCQEDVWSSRKNGETVVQS